MMLGNRLALAALVGSVVSFSCAVREVTLDTEDAAAAGAAGSAGSAGTGGESKGGAAGVGAGGAGQSGGGSGGADAATDATTGTETGVEAGDAAELDADSAAVCTSGTDENCGGSCPQKCSNGKTCKEASDCVSAWCNLKTHICVATQCEDGEKNGTETDEDCGGSCSANCDEGQGCGAGTDCKSSFCNVTLQHCVATQCQDGKQNGMESDIDCGGGCTSKCANGYKCAAESDCASTFCNVVSHVCVASQCLDGARNGTESDVDCGGSCAKKCNSCQSCNVPTDCVTNSCDGVHCGCGGLQECYGVQSLCLSPQVTIPNGNKIDATEVTYDQYKAWLDRGPTAPPPAPGGVCSWKTLYSPASSTGSRPVNFVDWCDAWAFCHDVGKRLCGHVNGGPSGMFSYTDANASQWYRACTSNAENTWPYGDIYLIHGCNTADHAAGTTLTVGSMSGCTSSVPGYVGIFDMSGNVSEWEDACDGSYGTADTCRLRGGARTAVETQTRCEANDYLYRNSSSELAGFRCCSL